MTDCRSRGDCDPNPDVNRTKRLFSSDIEVVVKIHAHAHVGSRQLSNTWALCLFCTTNITRKERPILKITGETKPTQQSTLTKLKGYRMAVVSPSAQRLHCSISGNCPSNDAVMSRFEMNDQAELLPAEVDTFPYDCFLP